MQGYSPPQELQPVVVTTGRAQNLFLPCRKEHRRIVISGVGNIPLKRIIHRHKHFPISISEKYSYREVFGAV